MSSIADALVIHAEETFEMSHDAAGQAWATERTSGETFLIGSASLSERLAHDLYRSSREAPSQSAIAQAATTLRGMALFDGPEHPVFVRVGASPDRIYLDLGDPERRVVEVSPGRWSLVSDPPVRFWRPEGMLALPVPAGGGELDALLAQTLDITDESSLVLLEGWLLGCLQPDGSKPVLMLSGEQGSGKSERARMLRQVIDPNAAPLRTMPDAERDLAIMARRSAVVGFDNVSVLSDEQSDALCRLATGGGFSTRRLFTDQDEVLFQAIRPVVLTSIPEVDRQPDLADRSMHVTFVRIGDKARRTERELRARFEEAHHAILGALLDATAGALENLGRTSATELPRMADLALFVTAAEPSLGHAPGTFVGVYLRNRDEAARDALEGSFVGRYLETVGREGFAGTATQLLDRLERLAGEATMRRRGWPVTPRGLAGVVRRLAPSLVASGYSVEFERTGHERQRIIRLTYLGHEGPAAEVVPLGLDIEQTEISAERIAQVIEASGLSEDWTSVRAANLALHKAGGNAFLAAAALNVAGVPAVAGGTWTAVSVRGVT